MIEFYYLKTCNTCIRIKNSLNLPENSRLQDIKEKKITYQQLDKMVALSGSYEALFSRRAKLYKEMGLKDISLTEKDYKHYILEHYTFLKRPVLIVNESVYIGNSQKTVKAAQEALEKL